jgi:AcrR family transcriptional regulator
MVVPTGRYGQDMRTPEDPVSKPEPARNRLLNAALRIVRQKGYHATSVDELCAAAGVTKGAFFHHFRSKEDLAVAAAEHWSVTTGGLFAKAPYHGFADPLDRVIGYLDFRAALIAGTTAEFTCLVGTMAQETFLTNPAIRDACFESISCGDAGGRSGCGHRIVWGVRRCDGQRAQATDFRASAKRPMRMSQYGDSGTQ